jgi:hypothetical protein
MFVDDSDELCELIMGLEEADFEWIKIQPFQNHIQQKGRDVFQQELVDLYDRTVGSTTPRDYLNAHHIEQLGILTNTFLTVYRHYLNHREQYKLRIVERYVREILTGNPSYIGFSLHSLGNVISRAIRRSLREACDLPLIAGGPVTPFLGEREMESMFSDDHIDYLVVGEGEHALPRLIAALEANHTLRSVENLVYHNRGTLQHNDRVALTELGSLPFPDFSQFDLDRYLTPTRILPVLTARGCAWGTCAFCSHHNI